MEKTVYMKNNGEVNEVNVTEQELKEMKFGCFSPCSTCDNGYASKCPKMADRQFKPIEMYDFISDGFEVLDDDGLIDELYITKCNNYVKDRPRKVARTKEEIDELRRLKESIKMLYFDAMDIDEANQTEMDLINRKKYRLITPQELYQINSDNAKKRK